MKKRYLALTIVIISVVTILIIFFPNMISQVKAPSKEKAEENQQSDSKGSAYEPVEKQVDYMITFDEDIYKLVEDDQSDTLTTKVPLEEKYPEVSLKIEQINDQSPEELLPILEMQMGVDYTSPKETEKVIDPVVGYWLHAISHDSAGLTNWDSPVGDIYIIDNGVGGSFVITQKYFLEAAEGHGSNFRSILETFQIVEK
ncbi:hypothetical protein [Psychrobacillus sp. BL-248-WT-3]|uniref:hypothetical protein n=1 Tax=Psychrobacillus sp. BL-248-WT-3 TaxID=2725306 RepID=UPI00146C1E96|nr:hypothetical protein [Psychrobacillus sp. BL-248-WT-3]NME05577.1 hypothetical protein [Psychrobacillus sp. BL-248-WT-3]